jgi:tetratricopeptide (TPR) repeat protein
MDLRAILGWGPDEELEDVLGALQVDVNFWKGHQPEPLRVDAVQEMLSGIAAEYLAEYDDLLKAFRKGDPGIAELVVRNLAASVRKLRAANSEQSDDMTDEQFITLLREWRSASHVWWLVSDADDLAKAGHIDQALDVYREALDESPRPKVHSELGRIIADRAGLLGRLVVAARMDADEDDPTPILSSIDFTGSQTEILDEDILKHPLGSHSQELLRLALDAYGRAYSAQVRQATDAELGRLEAESLFFEHCLVLDGLRAIFLEMNKLREAEIVCQLFEIWNLLITEQGGEAAGLDFQRRFSQTLGILEGRRIEATIQQAVLETRRAVVLQDADAFADKFLDRFKALQGPVPNRTQTEIRSELVALMGAVLEGLPDPSLQALIDAEWLRQLLDKANAHDYGAVLIGYGKALEGLMRHLDASKDNLSQFRQRFKKFREQRIRFLRVGSVNDELVATMTRLVDLRDRAAHGDDQKHQTVSLGEMLESRKALLGEEAHLGPLTRLLKARQT